MTAPTLTHAVQMAVVLTAIALGMLGIALTNQPEAGVNHSLPGEMPINGAKMPKMLNILSHPLQEVISKVIPLAAVLLA